MKFMQAVACTGSVLKTSAIQHVEMEFNYYGSCKHRCIVCHQMVRWATFWSFNARGRKTKASQGLSYKIHTGDHCRLLFNSTYMGLPCKHVSTHTSLLAMICVVSVLSMRVSHVKLSCMVTYSSQTIIFCIHVPLRWLPLQLFFRILWT